MEESKKGRRMPSPAMAVAATALFVALSGGAVAGVASNHATSSKAKAA